MTCDETNGTPEAGEPLKLPEPKKPILLVVPEQIFLDALKRFGVPDPEAVCVLPFLTTDGRDGLIFSDTHEITPLDPFRRPQRNLGVRGTISVIASIPVEGSKCCEIGSGSYGLLCCPKKQG